MHLHLVLTQQMHQSLSYEQLYQLLHVSQISKDHVEKPSDVLKVGQEVEAKIVDFNEEDKKISLSVKAMYASEDNDADTADVNIDEVASETEE